MNRPSPSLLLLAAFALILALVFLWRQYLSPAHRVTEMRHSMVTVYSRDSPPKLPFGMKTAF